MNISTTSRSITDRGLHCLAIVAMVLMNPFSLATAQTSEQEKFSLSIGLFVTDRDGTPNRKKPTTAK